MRNIFHTIGFVTMQTYMLFNPARKLTEEQRVYIEKTPNVLYNIYCEAMNCKEVGTTPPEFVLMSFAVRRKIEKVIIVLVSFSLEMAARTL